MTLDEATTRIFDLRQSHAALLAALVEIVGEKPPPPEPAGDSEESIRVTYVDLRRAYAAIAQAKELT